MQQSYLDALAGPTVADLALSTSDPYTGAPGYYPADPGAYTPMQDYYDQYGVDPYTSDNLAYLLALQQGLPYY